MPYDVERYLNVRSAGGASFGPSGGLAFRMDTTGVSQIWRLDEPAAWPEQLTFYEDRVTVSAFSPEREELAFGMDEGGNERQQLFRLAADGSEVHPLTDTPAAKHRWGGWSHDGERIAFTSNRRDEAVFDVYVQGRTETGDEARLVREGDGWYTVAGWSPDDTRLAVVEARSNDDQDVHVLDVETGEMEHLTPHEGDVRYGSVTWGPDGEAIYLVTDDESDTLWLGRLDLDAGGIEPVVDGPDGDDERAADEWNVDGVAIDHVTGRIVYSRNVDGYTELTVGDVDGIDVETYPSPELPEGVAGGVSFDEGAERFAVTATATDDNANVYVVDVETGAAERWTRAATAGIPRETFVSPELIRYESFDGLEVPAFLSTPRRAAFDPPYPVVVDVHGGPESQRRPGFSPITQYFLNNGYAVFEPNVRGSTGYGKAYTRLDDGRRRMDAVADVKAGVEWLGDRETIDPDRVVAMGGSYGGFVVLAALAEYPDVWAAGVDIVGIANFVTFLENTGEWRRELREAEYGSLAEDREFLAEISPVNNVEAIRAPLIVLHGANDPRVPVDEAEQIAREAGEHVPVEKLIFEDEGHGFSKLENRIEAYRSIVSFLEEHV